MTASEHVTVQAHVHHNSSPQPLAELCDLCDLRDQTALITGAGQGIGEAIATRFAAAGARVLVTDRNEAAAQRVARTLERAGHVAHARRLDVAEEAHVQAALRYCTTEMGGVQVVVNNAGIFPPCALRDISASTFDHLMAINLRGTFLCIREAARVMDRGAIVNVTSIGALHPSMTGLAHYDASKHGVWGLTRSAALELAPQGIRVNAVAPGGVRTPGVAAMSEPGTIEAFAARVPLGRMGTGEDIARAVLFLASDAASYITGAQLVVDGGVLLT